MNIDYNIPSPIHSIKLKNGNEIFIKREDLIHPLLSGNKYRKLKYNIEEALNNGSKMIISFGGAFSNHIHALSFACHLYGIPLKLFIRGEEVSNPTLDAVIKWNATLEFIDRKTYRKRNDKKFLDELHEKHKNAFIIPEGGSNHLALKGIAEMMGEIKDQIGNDPIEYCVAYGSGGTSLGMLQTMSENDNLNVFPVLKMQNFPAEFSRQMEYYKIQNKSYTIHSNFHFGGYAKYDQALIQFINSFKSEYGIALDPIYTGKLFFGVITLLEQISFPTKKKIVVIHSGGLQGIEGFNQRFGDVLI